MNFLELFNMVSQVARPAHKDRVNATSMDESLEDLGLDSLDSMIIGMYLCELFGIPEDDETKDWNPENIKQFYEFLMRRKTKEPSSIEAAREELK